MPRIDLDDADMTALIELLTETIVRHHASQAPRIRALRRVLNKLDRRVSHPDRLPPPKSPTERTVALARITEEAVRRRAAALARKDGFPWQQEFLTGARGMGTPLVDDSMRHRYLDRARHELEDEAGNT